MEMQNLFNFFNNGPLHLGENDRRKLTIRLVNERLIIYLCFLILLGGCVPEIKIMTASIPISYHEKIQSVKRVLVTGFEKKGGKCLRDEISAYLKESNRFIVINLPGPMDERELDEYVEKEKIDLVISGEIELYNLGISVSPFGGKDYYPYYATVSGKVNILDTNTDEIIWSKKDNTFVEAKAGRGKPEEILLPFGCKNLATRMLNDFMKSYASTKSKQ
jgi:hypothetical protein